MDVKEEDFEKEVLEKSREVVVVVDFWADWCVPCNVLYPVLEKVVEGYDGKVILVKVNIDQNPTISTKFEVNVIPSIKIFKSGSIIESFEGVAPEAMIKEKIDKVLQ